MLKDIYKSAMSKVKVGENFYEKAQALGDLPVNRIGRKKIIRLVPALLILIVAVFTAISIVWNNWGIKNGVGNNSAENSSGMFEYTESKDMSEASYISVVYLNGYAYEPSSWLENSIFLDNDYISEKGKKLGEVILDLKGKVYKGTPPDFSSTYDVGTEIYALKNVKIESAILVHMWDVYTPFYRSRKHVSTTEEEIGLTVQDIFGMLSDNPEVVSVELRDEENGAWMNTFEDADLNSMINKELPSLSLLNYGQLDSVPYASGFRVPVNLFFADGRALHLQIYPTSGMAYTFGGYIPISENLTDAFQTLAREGSPWPRLSDFLPFGEKEVQYLYLKNHTNGDEILCEDPAWSRGPLFQLLHYYRADKADAEGRLVMTAQMGKSESDNVPINFYEKEDGQILTEIDGVYYKPVHGRFMFESLELYLHNYTDLGS